MKINKELEHPEDYFPYIGHTADPDFVKNNAIYRRVMDDLVDEKYITKISDDSVFIEKPNSRSIFKEIRIKGIASHIPIAKDRNAVELLIPRHRSLYDYVIHYPLHTNLINRNMIFMAGDNLFVKGFDTFLRKCGAFMYLRDSTYIRAKGKPKVFLTKKKYMEEIFPAYLKAQMFDNSREDAPRMDLVIYPEQEKDPATNIRKGGRTKTGKLRNLNYLFFDRLKRISRESTVKLYVTAVNISFSKVPEAPYIVHPSQAKGIKKDIRYLIEQYYTYNLYPKYAHRHEDAKIEIFVNYGKPVLLEDEDISSIHDLLRFAKSIKEKIGLLEVIFPLPFLYRALDSDPELSFAECETRMKTLLDYYLSVGANVEKISDNKGNMLPAKEIIEKSIRTINANPSFIVRNIKKNNFININSGRIISNDIPLQSWYANNIRHLDPDT